MSQWIDYYKKTTKRPPHPLLKVALGHFASPGVAYDLGAGSGVDTQYLIKQAWKVHAVDQEEAALDYIKKKIKFSPQLLLERTSFETLMFQKCDLIFSSLALPFCHPDHFSHLWKKMSEALKPQGIICGNFFGTKDDWAINAHMTFMNQENVLALFKDFEILYFDEMKGPTMTTAGFLRHSHSYSFIIQKNTL
jgi:tellurite methyltransferase